MLWVGLVLLLPLISAVVAAITKNQERCELYQATGSGLTLICVGALAMTVLTGQPLLAWADMIYIDALGAFNMILIALTSFLASLYSVGYLRHDVASGIISVRQVRFYYFFFHLFVFTMLVVSAVNSLGLLWVGIELTTLISAVLVAFYGNANALEAAWKYLIMGSVGIALALLGIIFIYLSGIQILSQQASALNWTALSQVAPYLNPQWVKIGFIFILIGFGTKAGLAPMHFWLPDAHSQAPSPVSAVLSGVLLNTALYGLFRIYAIANVTLSGQASGYLIFFGLLSIAFVLPFITIQHDIKRMLAYSSVEHIGIITLSVGLGGTLGLYGAFLHMFNHSLTKALLFFSVGLICNQYHSKLMYRISGVLKTMPLVGSVFLVAALAITGAPPFSIFFSEITIMLAGFQNRQFIVTAVLVTLIVLVFAAMMFYVVKMVFGPAPAKLEPVPISPWSAAAIVLPLLFVVVCGWYIPPLLETTLFQVADVFKGVGR